ncbi:MAG: helix-turn-helix domain-containing protein [Clostridia bacterium]|nr:helix-turn-helix domain-containing protein [Clostridia bacterium]
MEEQDNKKLTVQMLEQLMAKKKLEEFLEDNKGNFINIELSQYLLKLIHDKGSTPPKVIRAAGIEKSYLYQILNGKRQPGRDKLLRIAFSLGLDIIETDRLLKIANKGILYTRDIRDASIIFCLNNKYSLDKSQQLLDSLGLEPLE